MVSIIIPVYNCEKYIEECIKSIVDQTYRNIEIIIVDDGSTDNTRRVCTELVNKDDRIKLFTIVNNGVSHARNLGLEKAAGDYIVFVDADDYLDLDIIHKAVKKMSRNCLLLWDYAVIDKADRMENTSKEYQIDKYEAIASAICKRNVKNYELGSYYRAVWGKMFDAEIIRNNKLFFPEDLPVGEDALFLISYLIHAESVISLNIKGYNYRILENSAVRKYRTNLLELDFLQMEYLLKILEKNGLLEYEPVKISFNNWKWQLVLASLLDNSYEGYKHGNIPFKAIFNDSKFFCEKYDLILKECPISYKSLYKKYRIIQPLYGKLPVLIICLLYIVINKVKGRC